MSLITVIIIAVSLSMDAFSLSLAYGTLNLKQKEINLLSIIVGLFHFFMPLIGMYFGNQLINLLKINPNVVILVVLTVIGIQMIISSFNQEIKIKTMNLIELISFGLAVSLDSFSVGLGLKTIYDIPIVCSIIFMLSSSIFTYLGLKIGKIVNDNIGKISTLIGGIVLIIIGILYMI